MIGPNQNSVRKAERDTFLLYVPARLKAASVQGLETGRLIFYVCSLKYFSQYADGLCVVTGLLFYAISFSTTILAAHCLEWLQVCLISFQLRLCF